MKKFLLAGLLVFLAVFAYAQAATVVYSANFAGVGWQEYDSDGATVGATGQGRQMEAMRIAVVAPVSGDIEYRTYVQNSNWQGWSKNNAVSGTQGQGLRIEAIQIRLTGQLAQQYDVEYRVHFQGSGWQPWVKNGADAGATGRNAKNIEAVEIVLLEKSSGSGRGRGRGPQRR